MTLMELEEKEKVFGICPNKRGGQSCNKRGACPNHNFGWLKKD